MPPLRHLPQHIDNQIWEQSEPTIRHLYQTERRTIKQVKEIMEAEHGFPTTPLPIYKTKLRNVLGLRKKLKKTDWTAIYQHCQNRQDKDTGIYLNGSRIPWDKAWKEIRRSGARSVSRELDIPLPEGIAIGTPSPIQLFPFSPPQTDERQLRGPIPPSPGSSLQELCVRPLHEPLTLSQRVTVYQPQSHRYASILTNVPTQEITVAEFLKEASIRFTVALSDIPWNTFKSRMLSAGFPALQVNVNLHEDWKAAFSSADLHLLYPGAASSPPAVNFDCFYFLAHAIRLASNNIMMPKEYFYGNQCPNVFRILLERVPTSVLVRLFQINHPTVRATWESVVHCAGFFAYRDSFNFLISAGLQQSGWVVPRGSSYLGFAVSMRAFDTVRGLLNGGARADGDIGTHEFSPLVEAAAIGDFECLKLLLAKCDLNRIVSHGLAKETPFSIFVLSTKSRSICNGALNMVLENGANVDSMVKLSSNEFDFWELYELKNIPVELRPTFMEYIYYQNVDVFREMVPYSTRRVECVTRSGIWLSAQQGQKVLNEYIISRSSDTSFDIMEFLKLVLTEQFVVRRRIMDTKVVQGLIEFGVDPKRAPFPRKTNYLLCRLVHKVPFLENEDFLVVLKSLLRSGMVIDNDVLEASVENKGISTLLILSQHGADIGHHGGEALSKAAWLNNYEAVSWLLDAGVCINAAVQGGTSRGFQLWSVIALASNTRDHMREWQDSQQYRSASSEMLKYLIDRGAELKNSPEDPNSFIFLCCFLSTTKYDGFILDKMKLFLSLKLGKHNFLGLGCLLEACLRIHFNLREEEKRTRLATFELLLESGVPVISSRVLPSLIFYEGQHETIRKLIKGAIDINIYSGGDDGMSYTPVQAAAYRGYNDLVMELVAKGADINNPAAGIQGRTALQAVCWRTTKTVDERTKKMELIKFLIEEGAEVDAPATSFCGLTALQCAAEVGDIEVALLLIHHGADPNAPPAAKNGGSCALDGAALNGRLDMVQFLLNVGALSHDRGHTGYEGAIHYAEIRKHFAVANLIREFAANDAKIFGGSLAMSFYEPYDDVVAGYIE